MENHRKEFNFINRSILVSVFHGILVGIFAGLIVVLFRLGIGEIFNWVQIIYKQAHTQPMYLTGIAFVSLAMTWFIGQLIKSDPDIKGSGIPQVEAELKGLMHQDWWSVLWKKFLGGVLSIGSGLMLGREGPSIQLGAVAGKGVSTFLKTSEMEKRSLIASGAAAGLAAAFNAPIAGLLFIVEEVYHQFSRSVWVSALAASITANFISQNIFGLTPVLKMPANLAIIDLSKYWIYIILGIFLGLVGYFYEVVILNMSVFYGWISNIFKLKSYYHSLVAFLLILPIGYYLPEMLGGGHHLILDLPTHTPVLSILLLYFVVRFIWSMISYGSGLPGGIFLPILTLGSILGTLGGRVALDLGLISQAQMTLFIVLGMAGFFAAISKAPLTAMILVTEMVGDLRQLMVIGLVSLTAYVIMDLLKGAPIYEAMLERLLPEKAESDERMTLIEVVVAEHLANKMVSQLNLPQHALITSQVLNGKNHIVRGNSRLHMGASIYVAVPVSEMQTVRELLEEE